MKFLIIILDKIIANWHKLKNFHFFYRTAFGLMIIRKDWSLVKYAMDQLYMVFIRFLKFINEKRCTNNHITQAIKPLICILGLGISATALLLPIIAIDPLS